MDETTDSIEILKEVVMENMKKLRSLSFYECHILLSQLLSLYAAQPRQNIRANLNPS